MLKAAIAQTTLVAVVVVLIILAVAAGYLATYNPRTPTSALTTGPAFTTTATTSSLTTCNCNATYPNNAIYNSSEVSNSTICEVLVEGNGVYLRIASDSSNQSLSGIKVLVTPKANSCYGEFVPDPFELTSNGSGWVFLNFPNLQANYYYQVSILDYDGKNYSFVLPQWPLETTIASINLPSGSLGIQLCETLYDPLRFGCQPFVNETHTGTLLITTATHG